MKNKINKEEKIEEKSEIIKPRIRTISKSKITNIIMMIKKWILNLICKDPTLLNPLSK
jgi:hypothetical protein